MQIKLTPLLEGKKLVLDENESGSTILMSEEDGKKYESTCIPSKEGVKESIATVVPDESGNLSLGNSIYNKNYKISNSEVMI